jgi:hypothetical protein
MIGSNQNSSRCHGSVRCSLFKKAAFFERGPAAQLGARFRGMEEVIGSIPTRSTNYTNALREPLPISLAAFWQQISNALEPSTAIVVPPPSEALLLPRNFKISSTV